MQTHAITDSPIGPLTLVNTDGVLSGLYMEVPGRAPQASTLGKHAADGFEQAIEELGEYFSGVRIEFTVATAARGDRFQHRV